MRDAERSHAGRRFPQRQPAQAIFLIEAAYLHVPADALTSLLAVLALLTGKAFGRGGWTR